MFRNLLVVLLLVVTSISCTNRTEATGENTGAIRSDNQPPPVVIEGGISVPLSVYEEETSVFAIDGEFPDDAEFLWTVDPPEAGVLGTPTFSEVGFQASDIPGDGDSEMVISVEIFSDTSPGEIRRSAVTILNVEESESWKIQWRAGGFDEDNDMCLDREGNIIVTGRTIGAEDLDPGLSKCEPDDSRLESFWDSASYVSKFDNNGTFLWARWWGCSAGIGGSQIGLGAASDSSGNVYVIGRFEGIVDFDSGPGEEIHESVSEEINSRDGSIRYKRSVYVISFDPDGNFRWVRNLDGSGSEEELSIDIDSSDNIACAGRFSRTSVGNYLIEPESDIPQLNDVFLLKMNTSGEILWYKAVYEADESNFYPKPDAVVTNDAGRIFITGTIHRIGDLDPGEGVDICGDDSEDYHGRHAYIAAFSPDGAYLWGRTLENFGTEYGGANGFAICTDTDNVYITGYYSRQVCFEGGPVLMESFERTNSWDGLDAYMLSVTDSGDFNWVTGWGTKYNNLSRDIGVSPDGAIFAVGKYNDVILDTDTSSEDSGDAHGYISKLSTNGKVEWVGSYNDWTWMEGSALDFDDKGNIYVMGFNRFDHEMCLVKLDQEEYF